MKKPITPNQTCPACGGNKTRIIDYSVIFMGMTKLCLYFFFLVVPLIPAVMFFVASRIAKKRPKKLRCNECQHSHDL